MQPAESGVEFTNISELDLNTADVAAWPRPFPFNRVLLSYYCQKNILLFHHETRQKRSPCVGS